VTQAGATGREAQVRARLARVTDPELDEPVTELDFITGVTVGNAGDVEVGFRLPTYWCAANFAFMMADDMRREVAALPWVRSVRVTLGEHMYADTINAGLAEGRSFQETFGKEASGDLGSLRRTFLVKAFQRRQHALLEHLLGHGYSAGTLAALTVGALRALDDSPLVERYLDKRHVAGPAGPDAPVFVDAEGERIAEEHLADHLRALKRVTVNVEFNGALCRGLLAARFREGESDPANRGLPHFIALARQDATRP
jgi:metal-sulfur cluster biosynthetic enzyme